jgi:F-type H+-transporting ATPase subunit epsilon
MAKIKVEVIEPTQYKIQDEFDHIIIPGIDGDFGVDQDHTAFITKIRPGLLQFYKGSKVTQYAIHDGFVTVEDNHVIIVCDTVEKSSEIDFKRASSAKERAEKRLKTSGGEIDFRRAEFALKKSLIRLELGNS